MTTNRTAVSKSAWQPIEYMRDFLRFLDAKGFKCKTIFDIGAFKGQWTEEALEVFPDAGVLMFEPLKKTKDILDKFCAEHEGARWFNTALGKRSGTGKFIVKPSGSGSYCTKKSFKKIPAAYEQQVVEMWALNDLIKTKKIALPELVKIDVQGFELEVLKGASKLFGKTEVFILEVSLYKFLGPHHPLFSDILSYMDRKGYALFDIIGFHRRSVDHALGQCDVCFVKQNSYLRERFPLKKPFEWDWLRRWEKDEVNIVWADGFLRPEEQGNKTWRWAGKKGTFYLVNRNDTRKKVDIDTFIYPASQEESGVEIRINGELADRLKIKNHTSYKKSFSVPAKSEVRVTISIDSEITGVAGQDRYFRLLNFQYEVSE
jgi:FkbM family methyltransferase